MALKLGQDSCIRKYGIQEYKKSQAATYTVLLNENY
jgi:hypothetical protein